MNVRYLFEHVAKTAGNQCPIDASVVAKSMGFSIVDRYHCDFDEISGYFTAWWVSMLNGVRRGEYAGTAMVFFKNEPMAIMQVDPVNYDDIKWMYVSQIIYNKARREVLPLAMYPPCVTVVSLDEPVPDDFGRVDFACELVSSSGLSYHGHPLDSVKFIEDAYGLGQEAEIWFNDGTDRHLIVPVKTLDVPLLLDGDDGR